MRASNTLNYGALMMVAVYISKFKEKYPEATFIVDNVEDRGLERIKFESQVDCIESFKELGVDLRPDCSKNNNVIKLIKYSTYANGFGKKIKNLGVDRVIQLGGDDFSEYYSIKALVIEFIKIQSLINNELDVLLVGQTIGPFTGWRVKLASHVLSKVTIFTRDVNCLQYLKNDLKLTNVYSSKDLAYLPLPMQNSKVVDDEVSKLIGSINGYITLVPSGLWKSYCSERDIYVANWVKLIEELISQNKSVVLLAHVISDTSDDRQVIKAIMEKLDESIRNKIVVVDSIISAALARTIISKSSCVISGRMHACVSALQTLVPTIPLSYSIKFKGVIGELEVENFIIECGNSAMWNNFMVVDKIKENLKRIESLDLKKFKIDVSKNINSIIKESANQIK